MAEDYWTGMGTLVEVDVAIVREATAERTASATGVVVAVVVSVRVAIVGTMAGAGFGFATAAMGRVAAATEVTADTGERRSYDPSKPSGKHRPPIQRRPGLIENLQSCASPAMTVTGM